MPSVPRVPHDLAAHLVTASTPHHLPAPPFSWRPTACRDAAAAQARQPGPRFLPDQLAAAYGLDRLWDNERFGEGVDIGVISYDGWSAADVSEYWRCFHPDAPAPSISQVGPTLAVPAESETTLDIEVLLSFAPQAHLTIFSGQNTTNGRLAAIAAAVTTTPRVQVISDSFGTCEPRRQVDEARREAGYFAQAAAQGQSVLAASGDDGSSACLARSDGTGAPDARLAVVDPAAQPDVTAVGGTALSGGSPPKEAVWNDAAGASGGGVSERWSMPPWQQAIAKPALEAVGGGSCAAPPCRAVPDVAAAGTTTSYVVEQNGRWGVNGGTSAATPLWAALVALMDEGCPSSAGFLNPALYRAADDQRRGAAAGGQPPFNDVTAGDNDFRGIQHGKYPARAGYDMATGLGTPNALGLAPYLSCTPIVSSVADNVGPITGGDTVTVAGSGFAWTPTQAAQGTGLSVSFGPGNPSTSVRVVSATELEAVVPPGVHPGAVDVTVSTPAGTSEPSATYTYRDAVVVPTTSTGFSDSSVFHPNGVGNWSPYDPPTDSNAIETDGSPAPSCAQVLPAGMPLRALSAVPNGAWFTAAWLLGLGLLAAARYVGDGSALWQATLPQGRWRAEVYEVPVNCLHNNGTNTPDYPDTARFTLGATGMSQPIRIDDTWSGKYVPLGDFSLGTGGGQGVVRFDGEVVTNNLDETHPLGTMQIAPVGSVVFVPEGSTNPSEPDSAYPTTSECSQSAHGNPSTSAGGEEETCQPALSVTTGSRGSWQPVRIPAGTRRDGEPPTRLWITEPVYAGAATASATWTVLGLPGSSAAVGVEMPPLVGGAAISQGLVTYLVSDGRHQNAPITRMQRSSATLSLGTWTFDRSGQIAVTLTNRSTGPGPIAAGALDAVPVATPCTLGYSTTPPTLSCDPQLHGTWHLRSFRIARVGDDVSYEAATGGGPRATATWKIGPLPDDVAYRVSASMPPVLAGGGNLSYSVVAAQGTVHRLLRAGSSNVDLGDYLPVDGEITVRLDNSASAGGSLPALSLVATPVADPGPCTAFSTQDGAEGGLDCPAQLLTWGTATWSTRATRIGRTGETYTYDVLDARQGEARWAVRSLDDRLRYHLVAQLPYTLHGTGGPVRYEIDGADRAQKILNQHLGSGAVDLGTALPHDGTIEVAASPDGGPAYAMDLTAVPLAPSTDPPGPDGPPTSTPPPPQQRCRKMCAS